MADLGLWRATALRLEVELGRRPEAGRAQALAQALAGWRDRPETADLAAEIAAARVLGDAYLASSRMPPVPSWPADEAPGVYPILAEEELRTARAECRSAAAARRSPAIALSRGARAFGWARGRTDGGRPFDDLSAHVDAAFGVAMGGPPGPARFPGSRPLPRPPSRLRGLDPGPGSPRRRRSAGSDLARIGSAPPEPSPTGVPTGSSN